MLLQEYIKKLSEYNIVVNFKENYIIVNLQYKPTWNIIEPENEYITFAPDKKVNGKYWYAGLMDYTEEIFQIIQETIDVNLEMEKKIALYNEKVQTLKELFLSDISLDKLKTLEFTFGDNKKKTGRKKKEKSIDDITNSIVENNNSVVLPEEITSEIDEKINQVLIEERQC